MGLITGLETVFYQVCNMDRAIAFYEGVLGFALQRREGNDWAELSVGDGDIALSGELAVAPQKGGATAVFRCSDIRALDEALATAGATRDKIEDMGGALSLEFYDPDGNRLVALQPD